MEKGVGTRKVTQNFFLFLVNMKINYKLSFVIQEFFFWNQFNDIVPMYSGNIKGMC